MKFSTGLGAIILLSLSCKTPKSSTTISGEDLTAYKTKQSIKPVEKKYLPPSPAISIDPIQTRYAGFLKINPANITNLALYQFIDRWLNTPYKWGGMDERGIDCSAFLQKLFAEVYLINIPRTSVEQFYTDRVDKFKSSAYLSEGDLVFFHTIADRPISHVGLYLQNGMFVNSSSSKGVSIASLKDPYWRKRYVAAGRIKNF